MVKRFFFLMHGRAAGLRLRRLSLAGIFGAATLLTAPQALAVVKLIAHTETHGDYTLYDYGEPVNRFFNRISDFTFPVIRRILPYLNPKPIRPAGDALYEVISTFGIPIDIGLNMLGGRPAESGRDFLRLLMKIPTLGLLDIGESLGIEEEEFSIHQVLIVWGLRKDIYVSLPLPLPPMGTLVSVPLDLWDPLGDKVMKSLDVNMRLQKLETFHSFQDAAEGLKYIPSTFSVMYEVLRRGFWQNLLSETFNENVLIEEVDTSEESPPQKAHGTKNPPAPKKKQESYDPYGP